MWIVRLALSRPYTFIVLAILLLLLGPLAIIRTPTDIFPSINIPVVSVVWSYTGLPPDEMGERIVGYFERALTTTVNDIEHIESESLLGVGVIKIFFQPSVKIDMALSQVTAISQTMLKNFPQGTTPPLVLSYNASTVPVLQLVLSSVKLSEQDLNDLGNNFLRTQLAVVQGAALPYPYGGKVRQIQVDLDQQAMQTYGISPADVNTAIGNQNLILPAGTEKIGNFEYYIKLNSSPDVVTELNDMPIKTLNGGVLYIRDVAHVRDGFAPQTNIVRIDGKRAVLMTVQKTGNASTLDIIGQVKKLIPKIKESMPPSLNLGMIGDQSIFVKAAIKGVVSEGVLAAILTGLMILLFLGSWRSTLIIVISIPLSVLASLITLSALGETINIMTLGGLALSVGILVDDATVAIENINWNLEQGKDVKEAILDGAQQIAIPALVSTLCICIVFLPMFFLSGVAHYLFVPLAEAVIFAMLASYFLSRTLVPTLAMYWLHKHDPEEEARSRESSNFFARIQHEFSYHFDTFHQRYHSLLEKALNNSKVFIGIFLAFLLISLVFLLPWIGEDFFPTVDAGQIKLHLRAPSGTRVEETAKIADHVDSIIHEVIPDDVDSIVDNIGLPISGINLSYSNSATLGPMDADILVSLKEGHKPTADYVRKLRDKLNQAMPGVTFAFLPADMVGQILNFGLPSPINIQVMGFNQTNNRKYAEMLLDKVKHIPGIVDARLRQSYSYPELYVAIDRSLSRELGFSQLDVASNLLISLSGSFQQSPTFWLSPQGVSYPIVTQTPQYDLDSLEALKNIPITKVGVPTQILGALATIERRGVAAVESHYNVQPVIDIFATVQDRDLGGVGKDINKLIAKTKKDLPKGSSVIARGQMQTQRDSFNGLFAGLAFAIILVYLLIVVNFQSWTDPFIIITALPAAITGIVWMLFLTDTSLSVPALTGAIMCMGVASANSILMVSFAREGMAAGKTPTLAALDAGFNRLRPVLMTALAMIIGMIPMSLGLGEGGEQNAPLGRAVIGGLLFATVATLFFVPSVFSIIHERRAVKNSSDKAMPS
jgi:CzcA family heavy metal efflux pump